MSTFRYIIFLGALHCTQTISARELSLQNSDIHLTHDSIIIEVDAVPPNHIPDKMGAEKKWSMPFKHNVVLESIGLFLMCILIALSNAGGLSGAGSNIPIMLIFFNMSMGQAVPVSAFVAVCATTFRFMLNYNQKHPRNEDRNCINYEIVSLAMPAVFLGSFFGVMLG